MRRALGAGLALGTAGALIGVFVVQRGLGLLADGLAHATFGGLALGLLRRERRPIGRSGSRCPSRSPWRSGSSSCGGAPAWAATSRPASSSRSRSRPACCSWACARRTRRRSTSRACCSAACSRCRRRRSLVTGPVAAVVVLLMLSLGPQLAYATFDPELARLSGVRVAALESLLLAVTALVVVVGVKHGRRGAGLGLRRDPGRDRAARGALARRDPRALARDQPDRHGRSGSSPPTT